MIKKIASITSPLCFISSSQLLCYKRGDIIILRNGIVEKRFPFTINGKERVWGRSRLANRLFRLGVRCAEPQDNNHVILCLGNRLQEIDVDSGMVSTGWNCGKGVRPLVMTSIRGFEGFDDGAYFGGYVHNHEKNPVSIYHRVDVDQWEEVYTFPQGAINHVHNIVADPYRKCIWIFTGDFGESAAIWKATDNFKKIEKLVGGDQRWRGSMAYVLPEGLLYATDTPRADDFLYLLNPETLEQQEIMPLHGSCIYGCKWQNNYVIATTVESEGGEMGFYEKWFGRKRGKGIKDEYVHMYCGNLKDGFREIYKEKKDWLPFTLFQFGVFKFPSGINNTDTLYFQPIATSKNDMALMTIK